MTKTIDVATTSVRDIERVLKAIGARVISKESTRGAVGYTTITIER